jgi:hypothetical protein
MDLGSHLLQGVQPTMEEEELGVVGGTTGEGAMSLGTIEQ